jgi:hypothetical protein
MQGCHSIEKSFKTLNILQLDKKTYFTFFKKPWGFSVIIAFP